MIREKEHDESQQRPTSASHLRVHSDDTYQSARDADLTAWSRLQQAITSLTGWQLEVTTGAIPARAEGIGELEPVADLSTRRFYCQKSTQAIDPAAREAQVRELGQAIVAIYAELQATRDALRHREAELATAVPVIARPEENADFTHRLQAVLRGTVEGLHARAAALYLLDDATTLLKLRSHWGLPCQRFLDPPRPLRGAVADLEALAGHAVVLEDTTLFAHWNVPESFGSAVCVPVSSPDALLGTLWLFDDQPRDFSHEETQLVEIVAGRLAAELDRRVLSHDAARKSERRAESRGLSEWHEERIHIVPPLCDGWQVAATLIPNGQTRGDFPLWHVDRRDQLWIAAAACEGGATDSLLAATALRGALQAGVRNAQQPSRLLQTMNDVVWSDSEGHEGTSLFCGAIQPRTGRLTFAHAGHADAYILRPHGWEPIVGDSPLIGLQPDWDAHDEIQQIQPGDVLLVISHRDMVRGETNGRPISTTWLAEALLRHLHLTAQDLSELACSLLSRQRAELWARSIVVVRRAE